MSRLLMVAFAFLVGAVAGDTAASITRTPLSRSDVRSPSVFGCFGESFEIRACARDFRSTHGPGERLRRR
jgi:hypothetical protein